MTAVFSCFPPILPSFSLALQMSELEPEEPGSEPTKIDQSNETAEALPDKEAPLQPDQNSTAADKT